MCSFESIDQLRLLNIKSQCNNQESVLDIPSIFFCGANCIDATFSGLELLYTIRSGTAFTLNVGLVLEGLILT